MIDANTLPGKVVRINITLSERVLRKVDRFAEATGDTRSGLLAEAATRYVNRKRTEAKRRHNEPLKHPTAGVG
jgi:metal-responsive CopG/Arc/MetJ family transcriptional regulator